MCLICGSPEAEPHFGGVSCRACAAFFRRYFHSKKAAVKCTCKERAINSHSCRKCRIEKCLKIGMTPDKIQKDFPRKFVCQSHMIPSGSSSPSSPPSLLNARIISRSTFKLECAVSSWNDFLRLRSEIGGTTDSMNVYDRTSTTKVDIELTWNMVMTMFPSTRKLEDSDKGALLRNFLLKMWIVVPLFHCSKYAEDYSKISNEAFEEIVFSWYDGTFEKEKELPKNDIMRVFKPFWHHFFNKTLAPIAKLKLDSEELMAIIWLVFFDHGYTNISSHCVETCRNIKKVIFRELKNYQNEGNHDEFRFIDTIGTLNIIAKEEQRVIESFLVYEMYNVRIHKDFMAIVKEERY